jgi:hypothetical protein
MHCCSVVWPLCLILSFGNCSGGAYPMSNSQQIPPSESSHGGLPLGDHDLINLVRLAGEGEGNTTALQKIQSLPRGALVAALTRIQQGLAEDDGLRVKLAYLFCLFDHEYASNRSVLMSAFSGERHYKGTNEEDILVKLGVLIRRGDKELLGDVFAKAGRADGALGEGLLSIFEQQISDDAEGFISVLKKEPPQTKQDVYSVLEWAQLSQNELDRLKLLANASSDLEAAKVARDILMAQRPKPRH